MYGEAISVLAPPYERARRRLEVPAVGLDTVIVANVHQLPLLIQPQAMGYTRQTHFDGDVHSKPISGGYIVEAECRVAVPITTIALNREYRAGQTHIVSTES